MTESVSIGIDLTGQMLDERYHVERLLGQGGMGKVYEATHVSMERRVAIKVLNQELTQNEQALKRFNREMKVSSQIEHPNSIQVFDYGQLDDGRCYLVMEFLEGKTLGDSFEGAGALSAERIVGIAEQVLLALGSAHEKGIVHRDLKPDNVMLVPRYGNEDFVKVLDFGIASILDKDVSKLTMTGAVLGTPYYMSPEQASGLEFCQRSDLYSLGVMLYEMVTGRVPFDGESMVSLLVKHVQEPPVPPNSVIAGCATPALEKVILRLLEKKPEQRPQDAAETIRLLKEAVNTSQSAAQSTPLDEQAPAPTGLVLPDDATLAFAVKATTPASPLVTPEKDEHATLLSQRKQAPARSGRVLVGVAIAACLVAVLIVMGDRGGDPKNDDGSKRGQTPTTRAADSSGNNSLESDTTGSKKDPTTEKTQALRSQLDAQYRQHKIPDVPKQCQSNDPVVLVVLSRSLRAHMAYEESRHATSNTNQAALRELNETRAELEKLAPQAENSVEYWTFRAMYTPPTLGASELIAKASELCDTWAYSMSRQGRIFEANQALNQASVAYERAIALQPEWLPPLLRRLLVAGKQAKWAKALTFLSMVLDVSPREPVAKAFIRRYLQNLEEVGADHPATQGIGKKHPNWRELGSSTGQ